VALTRLPQIEPLHLADVTLPDFHPRYGEPCPVYAFLIHHPDGPVLFDTGVGTGHEGIDKLYAPQHHPLSDELKTRDINPADVIAILNSHLHFDHCGENRMFPNTPIYVQRAEFEAAHETPLYSIPEWIDFDDADYRLLDGKTEVLPGITAMPTPGHTPGHQSLAIESEEGLAIIAGHGVYSANEWTGAATPVPGEWNDAQYTASSELLRLLEPVRVYFSHDAVVWERR
jgi:glyoxylase-like metal-dependent hydrolase (beta-lactamase superfamily II)